MKDLNNFYNYLKSRETNLIGDIEKYYGYKYDILDIMIFIWQQSIGEFYRLFRGSQYLDYFISKFEKPKEGSKFYRGLQVKYEELTKDEIIVAASKDINIAIRFAESKSGLYDIGFIGCYNAEKILDCTKYGTVDNEEEVILYKPKLRYRMNMHGITKEI